MDTTRKKRQWERYHTSKKTPKHDRINTWHFPIQPDRRTSPPLHPSSHGSHPLTPPFFLSTVVSSDAARQKAAGTMEFTHASFPLPELCFPYGNPLCVCVCVCVCAGSGTEGYRQNRATTQNNPSKQKNSEPQTETQNSKPLNLIFFLNSTSQEIVWF